jgi:hypothetical protein
VANYTSATTAIASGAYTTTQTSADIANNSGRNLTVIFDVTAAGTGSGTITINGKDPASGKYYPLLTGAAVTTTTTTVYHVGPGLPATANVSANIPVPKTIQILVTANNANAMTYSVGVNIGV